MLPSTVAVVVPVKMLSLSGSVRTTAVAAGLMLLASMTTLLTLACGPGYAVLGAGIFWAMAGLCGVVVVLVAAGSLSRE